MSAPFLRVEDLRVSFGQRAAVEGVSFDLRAGEVLAVVGESGSGKTVTALTLLGLTRGSEARVSGTATLDGLDLVGASEEELRRVRGGVVGMIFQDPLSSLNPVHRVVDQVAEAVAAHGPGRRRRARERALELLSELGLAERSARAYPHELSGGMRQRAMLAIALAGDPRMLIADEPTTALDVTIQAQILERLRRLREERGLTLLLVTHDLGVVAEVADRVAVMYAGRIVEEGTAEAIFHDPQHPYTWGLLDSIPRLDRARTGRLPAIAGAPPAPDAKPEGCHFRPRCPHEFEPCPRVPELVPRAGGAGHSDRCHLPADRKRLVRRAAA